MMELFRDFTVVRPDQKFGVMIPKREFNPQLSVFQNMVLDIIDFKERVRPMANDIAMYESASHYQKMTVSEMNDLKKKGAKLIEKARTGERFNMESLFDEENESGYSSLEAPEEKAEPAPQEPEIEEPAAVEEQAADIFNDEEPAEELAEEHVSEEHSEERKD